MHSRFIAAFFILCENKRVKTREVIQTANYPNYGYQPQQPMGYQPQMPQMYQQYQQQPVMQEQQEQFFCRPVASADEARGIPVDFSGRPMILPNLRAGRIYVKVFDQGSGSAIFREFRMHEEPAQEAAPPAVAFAPMSEVEELKAALQEMREELKALKAAKRKMREAADDEN